MSNLQPILVHGHSGGPNPWKVVMLLEELKLPYDVKFWEFQDLKKEPFEKLNINGRTPVIEDPNNGGIVLWESGAILEYLVETYDKQNTLTYTSGPEKYYVKQWLHFQVSGQGPYYGQKMWFTHYHSEKIPSAVSRYAEEIKRVTSVIDAHLKRTGSDYLVGNKYTYADLAFIPWQEILPMAFPGEEQTIKDFETKYPSYWAWWKRVTSRPAIEKTLKDKKAAMAKGH